MSAANSDELELFDTQTPDPQSSIEPQKVEPKVAWGRLFPTTVYLPPVDCNKNFILLGRAVDCDIILTKNNFSPTSLNTVSKNHFMIIREGDCQTTYIKDLSKNGTFVNGIVIGNGRQIILGNDDEIAIGTARQRVYVYKTIENGTTPYLPPQLKCKYEISRVLGTGACGEVRLAFEKTTFKEYAIKRIIKSKEDIKSKINNPLRIQSEVEILQSLSHPFIISTKEVVDMDEAVFIVLEYMEGGELTDLIHGAEEPLPEDKVKLLFYQMVVGVRFLHLRGITHRDLKPGNVLLKSNNPETLIKISDFGLSKMIDSNSLMSTVCGTPTFVAPEIIDCKCTMYTQQIDVWSLGVILFYMLSKELPFKSDSQQELFKMILAGKYDMVQKPWSSVSKDAKDLVSKMLVKNPEDRITVHDIMNHPWIAQDLDVQRRAKQLMNEDSEPVTRDAKRARLDTTVL